MEGLKANYDQCLEAVQLALEKAGRPSDAVTFIAVSKGQSVDQIEQLYHWGHRDFGENYVQELLEKAKECIRRGCVGIRWHFIGKLQRNKVAALLPVVSVIHSVDSWELALKLNEALKNQTLSAPPTLPIFIQINTSGEKSKGGVLLEQAPLLAERLRALPQLQVMGWMALPAPHSDSRSDFKNLKALQEAHPQVTAGHLSMGMSDDFTLAIQEGATEVRVGTRLFGSRASRSSGV